MAVNKPIAIYGNAAAANCWSMGSTYLLERSNFSKSEKLA